MPNNPITNNSVRSDGSQETLSDYVRRVRNEKHLSCADVERRSARFGKRIAGSYVNRIENDPRVRPTADRLRALANGLGVSIPELMARAFGIASYGERSSEELSLITRFRELSCERKEDVLKLVDLFYSEAGRFSREREPALYIANSNPVKKKGTDHAK
jgi:transcriptional regulator with XRE-family HTH domain